MSSNERESSNALEICVIESHIFSQYLCVYCKSLDEHFDYQMMVLKFTVSFQISSLSVPEHPT